MVHSILRLAARLYGFGVRFRLTLYLTGYRRSKRLNRFTISIGNITAGGTGKTPLVEYVARLLIHEGYRVSILTRGYGRARWASQVVLNAGEGPLPDVSSAGDEPLMLARHLHEAIIMVNRNRLAAGTWAEAHAGAEVHVLDDGFQHLALDRDMNFLVIDAEHPFDSGELLPLGRLREPLSEVGRASAVILTRTDQPFDQQGLEAGIRRLAKNHEIPIFYAYHDLVALRSASDGKQQPPQAFEGRLAAALCAIARPDLFVKDLEHFGIRIVRQVALRDHARFTADDLIGFFAETQRAGAECVFTTEKDWSRLEGLSLPAEPPLWIAEIKARIVDEGAFRSYLLRSMGAPKR